jgi:pyruvate ferredoxin oxidoreductase gamma subunit
VLATTQTLASLSTALGVAAARLVGLTLEETLVGLDEELAERLAPAQKTANRLLATAVSTLVSSWTPVQERAVETAMPTISLAEVAFDPPRLATPSIYAMGNSPERKTGNWRQFRPVLHPELCTRCWICFVRCPEAAISLDANDYPIVDYDECKGCLLCVHECPTHAFTVEKEVR